VISTEKIREYKRLLIAASHPAPAHPHSYGGRRECRESLCSARDRHEAPRQSKYNNSNNYNSQTKGDAIVVHTIPMIKLT